MSCAYKKIDTGIAQGATRVINFVDADTVDYSDVSEITVDVWRNNVNGTNLLSKSLTGGSVTVYDDNAFRVTVDATESEALPHGRHHIEVWITRTDTTRRLVGMGNFTVSDTRKFD